ncbi:hypothetical protein Kpho01_18250 [Kitasatospora phosalacinea]|uniref:Uncharacterized protein n=1 Tax=Kitasatospora phosalacinea TaxID=2065 RepID=A0A9W6PDE6_9ACTN|nr:hypothetical protein Kpho01_18250 [Kitasatospora phosalacinea]
MSTRVAAWAAEADRARGTTVAALSTTAAAAVRRRRVRFADTVRESFRVGDGLDENAPN